MWSEVLDDDDSGKHHTVPGDVIPLGHTVASGRTIGTKEIETKITEQVVSVSRQGARFDNVELSMQTTGNFPRHLTYHGDTLTH
ncbi:hypothetical protein DPMN_069781 [Dreissena polymorpha]|uniref:Uncharacterized protein n=1 Tax=Dreissena polymorpha TaxID=45954 RepID=A0A9D3Z3X4_DREPO|nr:hypothetical protein DPMN_069781 [Dreissena polymorpha]